uniref:Uncharacterized protein n=1 Tax=Panagrolaimus sp. ES5 TaxID=591445 RepID=A0AC34FVC1_9BILA
MESEILIVANGVRQFIKRRGTYFFNTTAVTVSHTTTLNKNHTFSATINVVNLTKIHRKDDCKFIEFNDHKNGKSAIWTRDETDFDTKIKCQKNVTVVSGHQLYATITLFDLEKNVDALRYYDNDTALLHPIEILTNDTYVFLTYPDNLNRNVTWEFTSDESISFKNFSVEFKSIECKCADKNFIIPCEGERNFTVMGDKNELYCANLNCSYTVQISESCPDKSILLKAYPDFANPDCDYIHLISENETLINTSDVSTKFEQSTIQTALVFPNRSTILDFKSFPGTRIDKVSGAVINVGIGKLRIWATTLDGNFTH